MNILIDCDGVLCDFVSAYLRTHEQLNGKRLERRHVTDFDFTKCVATEEEDERVWRHIDRTPGFVGSLDWEPGAHTGLAALREMGTVRCITSPHLGPTWMHERAQWLLNRGFKKREIIFCADKKLVPGDVFIDDKLEHCAEWSAEHGGKYAGKAILLDAPYNRHASEHFERAANWKDVVELVRREWIRRSA